MSYDFFTWDLKINPTIGHFRILCQCLGRILGIIGQRSECFQVQRVPCCDLSVSLRLIGGYKIRRFLLTRLVIFLQSWTSTGYSSKSYQLFLFIGLCPKISRTLIVASKSLFIEIPQHEDGTCHNWPTHVSLHVGSRSLDATSPHLWPITEVLTEGEGRKLGENFHRKCTFTGLTLKGHMLSWYHTQNLF